MEHTSVAYSNDASHIVSGSQDKTIRVENTTMVSWWQVHSWTTQTGSPVLLVHLMIFMLSLALVIRPLGFGMQPLVMSIKKSNGK